MLIRNINIIFSLKNRNFIFIYFLLPIFIITIFFNCSSTKKVVKGEQEKKQDNVLYSTKEHPLTEEESNKWLKKKAEEYNKEKNKIKIPENDELSGSNNIKDNNRPRKTKKDVIKYLNAQKNTNLINQRIRNNRKIMEERAGLGKEKRKVTPEIKKEMAEKHYEKKISSMSPGELLNLAKSGFKEKAWKKSDNLCNEVINRYPSTKYSKEAEELKKSIKINRVRKKVIQK